MSKRQKIVTIILSIVLVLMCFLLFLVITLKDTKIEDIQIGLVKKVAERITKVQVEEEKKPVVQPEQIIEESEEVVEEKETILVNKPIRRDVIVTASGDKVDQKIYTDNEEVGVIDKQPIPDIIQNTITSEEVQENKNRVLRNKGLVDAGLVACNIIDTDGNKFNFSEITQGVVIIPWTKFNNDSLEELSKWQKIYSEYTGKIQFVLLNRGFETENHQNTKNFLDEKGYTFPVYYDKTLAFNTIHDIQTLPQVFFVNKDGFIVSRVYNSMTEEDIYEELKKLEEWVIPEIVDEKQEKIGGETNIERGR